ncbi:MULTISPECIES: ECF-type riboflavin transporter substrate-binding protein [Enterococcus]|uniref:UPF0397 protein KUA55_11005 n=1 Tax=Enterococcus alishanensis TaxID=1303817 RepID=A0ABS6TEE4_9ENTE|nr:ECF-type riboflavin transporter substrate-binding protein [Enterococcus alishanensis]MBV7391209.1 ECF-type riboflavin transporter substrate-binding protein [Enterococcus alishanensis]
MNKGFSVKTIVAIGIGAAVFVILGRFVTIPTGIPNTNLQTTYPFLALMSVLFGPIAGGLIGLIGHTLVDFTTYGPWWSWIICSGVMGIIFGLAGRKIDLQHGVFGKKEMISFNIFQIIGNVAVWAVLAPILDILIYSEPANKVFTQGIVSAILNALSVAIIGTIIMKAYAATQTKQGSLTKD